MGSLGKEEVSDKFYIPLIEAGFLKSLDRKVVEQIYYKIIWGVKAGTGGVRDSISRGLKQVIK